MTEVKDIYRTANLLVLKHGDDASVHAAMRADEMLAAGDMNGRAVWIRILSAVKELLSTESPGGTEEH